jgi:hypothetical protein
MEYSCKVANRLQEVLGQRLTAYCVGLKDPKSIGRYSQDEEQPSEETSAKLVRLLSEVVEPVLRVESPETLRAWFMGMNPDLGD